MEPAAGSGDPVRRIGFVTEALLPDVLASLPLTSVLSWLREV
jgi:hypothetical protein